MGIERYWPNTTTFTPNDAPSSCRGPKWKNVSTWMTSPSRKPPSLGSRRQLVAARSFHGDRVFVGLVTATRKDGFNSCSVSAEVAWRGYVCHHHAFGLLRVANVLLAICRKARVVGTLDNCELAVIGRAQHAHGCEALQGAIWIQRREEIKALWLTAHSELGIAESSVGEAPVCRVAAAIKHTERIAFVRTIVRAMPTQGTAV